VNCDFCIDGWLAAERDERGFTKNVRPCECQLRRRVELRIPAKYGGARLSGFKGATISAVGDWLEQKNSPGLFIFGAPGIGKTFLAVAICRTLLEAGQDVLLRSAARFYRELRGGFNSERGEESILNEYVGALWLLLDDLGAGALTDFERRYLQDLLDQRADRRTIITSNLTVADFGQRLDERIASRLSEFTSLRFTGADRRAQRQLKAGNDFSSTKN